MTLVNQTRASILGDRIGIANTSESRRMGLLSRRKLEHGDGLLLTDAQTIHTFGMRFPIDLVFIDGMGTVIGLSPDLQPGRTATLGIRTSVLELPAGTIAATGTELGDSIVAEDRHRQFHMAPAYAGGNAC